MFTKVLLFLLWSASSCSSTSLASLTISSWLWDCSKSNWVWFSTTGIVLVATSIYYNESWFGTSEVISFVAALLLHFANFCRIQLIRVLTISTKVMSKWIAMWSMITALRARPTRYRVHGFGTKSLNIITKQSTIRVNISFINSILVWLRSSCGRVYPIPIIAIFVNNIDTAIWPQKKECIKMQVAANIILRR